MRNKYMQSILQKYDLFSGIEYRTGNLQYLWIVPTHGIAASLVHPVAALVPLSARMSESRVAQNIKRFDLKLVYRS